MSHVLVSRKWLGIVSRVLVSCPWLGIVSHFATWPGILSHLRAVQLFASLFFALTVGHMLRKLAPAIRCAVVRPICSRAVRCAHASQTRCCNSLRSCSASLLLRYPLCTCFGRACNPPRNCPTASFCIYRCAQPSKTSSCHALCSGSAN